jgi:hypothetical protein
MISPAGDASWPGFEAFFVHLAVPSYLIQVERRELADRLRRGETLEMIVVGAEMTTIGRRA